MAGAAVTNACEGQNLDLVQHILAQAGELGTARRVAFHQPEPGLGVRVLLLVPHLPLPTQTRTLALVWSSQTLSGVISRSGWGMGKAHWAPWRGLAPKGQLQSYCSWKA